MLFHNNETLYLFDSKGSTFWIGSWSWNWNCLQSLNVSFTTTPSLIQVNTFKPFISKTNAFNFVLIIFVSQLEKMNFFYHVGFNSHIFFLQRLIARFTTWILGHYGCFWKMASFKIAQHEIKMYFNHKNLLLFFYCLCFELMWKSMGIMIVLILVCYHIMS
jgi:hypothetical protein